MTLAERAQPFRGVDALHDQAAQQWATALRTYRSSVDLYRIVLAIKARRGEVPRHPRLNGRERPRQPGQPASALDGPVPSACLNALSRRELEVVALIARGHTNQQIADVLVVTRGTVANHVAHILDKLDLQNRTQVAAHVYGERSAPDADLG